jgi:hypothetical protein
MSPFPHSPIRARHARGEGRRVACGRAVDDRPGNIIVVVERRMGFRCGKMLIGESVGVGDAPEDPDPCPEKTSGDNLRIGPGSVHKNAVHIEHYEIIFSLLCHGQGYTSFPS